MKVTKLDGEVPLRLLCEGDITLQTLVPDRDRFLELLGPDAYSATVLLSLERTTYIDSSGISWLLIAHKHFKQGGGKLVIHSSPPVVDHVLRLLNLQRVLNLAGDESAARALIGGGQP